MTLYKRKTSENEIQTYKGAASAGMESDETAITVGLPVRDALTLFYYLMSADGTLHDDELEKFDAIYRELDGSEYISQKVLLHRCKSELDAFGSSADPVMRAIACVNRILYSPTYLDNQEALDIQETLVSPRLLVWNLLAIAYSDGGCHDSERNLISYIAGIVGVEDALVLEMESYVLTLLDLEREETWIKMSNQPYLVIESVLDDLQARKSAVFDGAQALINL